MRIGIFTDAYLPAISGVVTSVLMLRKGLIEQGHEVYIITTSYKGYKKGVEDDHIIRYNGVPIPMKGLTGYRWMFFYKRHCKKLKKLNLDVIHIHTEFTAGRLGFACSKKYNIPVVYTVHTMYEDYMHHVIPFAKRLLKPFFMWYVKSHFRNYIKHSNEVILPDKKVEEMFNRYKIEKNYRIIPSGLDIEKFYRLNYKEEEIKALKDSLGIKDQFVCLFVGRVAKEKSIDMIIDEFNKSLSKSNALLVIVGDGPAKKLLEQQVKSLGLVDKVIFTGFVDWSKIGIYYQLGDVFVNASITETQGLTYIEALAAGLPVVVRYDTNLEQLIVDNENGIFFRTFDEFTEKLNNIVSNRELVQHLKDNASKSVEKYGYQIYSKKCLELYTAIQGKGNLK